MSQWRGRIEEIEEPGDVAELFGEYYQIPSLVALMLFMLWTRVRSWENFVVDGTVFFNGNDPWYHYRMTSYTVRNWPQTSPFDPWTHFPVGSHSSQFGTIFDQIVATIALIVGLGNPSDHTIRMVALFAPVLFGLATAIPVYYIGRRTSNRFAGIVAVAVLTLAPSAFFQRSMVGAFDHHIAEVFFQTLAILATMVTVSVAEEEKPVWELFEARDVEALRRPVGWAILAGVALAAYVWAWPPGVFLVGILGIYYVVELSSEYAHGESPEHVAIAGAISLGTAGVLILASLESFGVSSTSFSLLQPGVAFGGAIGCVFMAWLAREWDDRDFSDVQYPVAVAAIIGVVAAAFSLVLPETFSYVVDQVLRVIGLDATPTARTISEAQPMPFERLYDNYYFTHYIALVGVAYIAVLHFWKKPRAELTLLALWLVFTLLATLTQVRFDYYFAVAVASMTGLVVGQFTEFAELFEFEGDIKTYQLLTILAIVMVVFAPIAYPMMANSPESGQAGIMSISERGAGPAPQAWNETLGWMQDNTPEEGNYEGAGNEMDFYGTFEHTDDYEYDPGFYGVISWWDYGHWITTMGERIPNANPFQHGSEEAANFVLSGDEEQANEVIERMEDGENAETRYVMVDWKMVNPEAFYRTEGGAIRLGAKFGAPFEFYTDGNISQEEYTPALLYRSGQSTRLLHRKTQNYFETTAVRLYKFHGSAIDAQPVVLDWEFEQGGPVSNGTIDFRHRGGMEAARNYVENDSTSQIGGFGKFPEENVPAMEHYRLVDASERSATSSGRYLRSIQKFAHGVFGQPLIGQTGLNQQVMSELHPTQPKWVKTFERVDGATIEGEGPANETVRAAVEMQMPHSNATFVYKQYAETGDDGQFTMTVPYSTTGYDEWTADEGYTNTSVRATGPYSFETLNREVENDTMYIFNGTVDVTEGQVIGEDDAAATVELDRTAVASFNQTQPGTDGEGNESAPENRTVDDGTGATGNETNDGEEGTSDIADGAVDDLAGAGGAAPESDSETTDSSAVDPRTALSLAGLGLVGLVFATRRP